MSQSTCATRCSRIFACGTRSPMRLVARLADVLKGAFQLYTLQWVGVSDPDILRRVFHSSQVPPAGFNRGYYSNPKVDQLIDQATVSTDLRDRQRLYSEAQRLIAEDS